MHQLVKKNFDNIKMHGIYVKIQNIVLIPIIEEMSHCFKFPSRKWDLSSVALQNKSAFFRLLYNARARAHTHTHTHTHTHGMTSMNE